MTILSVEVRDILLPKELQEAMSLEAQAEQRKKARIILMEAEHDISLRFRGSRNQRLLDVPKSLAAGQPVMDSVSAEFSRSRLLLQTINLL